MIKNKKNGFIALISVIIISFVLLLIAITLNFIGFYGRFNILDSENKERSAELADACIETARLNLALNNTYSGNDIVVNIINNEKCEYDANLSNSQEITAHACVNNAHTYYKATVNTSDSNIPITSFEELPTSSAFAYTCNL